MLLLKQRISSTITHTIPLAFQGSAWELGSETLIFTAKHAFEDSDGEAIFQKELGAGIEVDGTDAFVTIIPLDTAAEAPGFLLWDMWAIHPETGARTPVADGRLQLQPRVTQEDETSLEIYTTTPPRPSSLTSAFAGAAAAESVLDTDEVLLKRSTSFFRATLTQIKNYVLTFLGNSATRNVGTTAGTVAAGDHAHAGLYDPAGSAASAHAAAVQRSNHTGTQALSTLSQSGASTNQVATWNGTAWVPAAAAGGGGAHAASHRPNGSDPLALLDNLSAVAAPTVSADRTAGYEAGSKWVHSGTTYWCMDNSTGAAIWVEERTPWTGYRATREIWLRRMMRKDSRYVLPSIEAFKLILPTQFLSRSRVASGDVRIISIGNSYAAEAWPQLQFEQCFAHMNAQGNYLAQQSAISSGNTTLTGGASYNSGPNGTSTLVPNQEGELVLPAGSTATIGRVCRGYELGYLQTPGGGTLTVEVSADNGTTWTHYTTSINTNGATAYLAQEPPSLWGRGLYQIRLTASVATVRVGLLVPTGTLSFHHCVTGSSNGGGYLQWSASNLIREATEAWWGAYDPDIVFVRYSDDQALDEEWSRFVSILSTACPNAQIIVTGEHSNSNQWVRDVNDGEHTRRNDSLRLACQALPNFSFIDCLNWLPNFTDAHALGSMKYNDPPTNLDPDNIHLSTAGGDIVRALQWECLRPWLFPTHATPSALNNVRARTIFETAGWEQTSILQSDVSVTNDTDATNGPNLFTFSGLDPQGWYELDLEIRITSDSTVRAKLGLGWWGVTSQNVRDGWFWNNAGTIERFLPPVNNNPGVSFPGSAFAASPSSSSIIYHARLTFQLNDSAAFLANRRGFISISGVQASSSATAVVFGTGSKATLRKANRIGGGGDYHRNLLPL